MPQDAHVPRPTSHSPVRLSDPPPYTRNFERARHHTTAANPTICLGGNRAHTETTALGQLTKSQQDHAPAFESRQITARRFAGPWNLPDQPMGHGAWGVRVDAR
jgi:hypothetical protein